MFCDVCKSKEATVYLTEIIDGKMRKINLCETCSKEKGITDPKSFALAEELLGLGAAQELEKGHPVLRCEVCGFTQLDFKKTGRLGCSACYDTFAEGLASLLKSMHKGVQHVGKIPKKYRKEKQLGGRIKTLRGNLDQAVADEQYEKAAQLRDEIKKLETDFNS
jgi:protein arginine kinase activator